MSHVFSTISSCLLMMFFKSNTYVNIHAYIYIYVYTYACILTVIVSYSKRTHKYVHIYTVSMYIYIVYSWMSLFFPPATSPLTTFAEVETRPANSDTWQMVCDAVVPRNVSTRQTLGFLPFPETNSEFTPGNWWQRKTLRLPFWDAIFSGAMLVSGRVADQFVFLSLNL